MTPTSRLKELPSELRQQILSHLNKNDLSNFNLASKWCYELATPLIWRDVLLTDCERTHKAQRWDSEPEHWRVMYDEVVDQHDDTPMIRKLVVLVTPFTSLTLSPDIRTTKLILMACKHMTRLHTLRLIFGHPAVNDALICGLFDSTRENETPVRRLWLENCRIPPILPPPSRWQHFEYPQELSFAGLESVRFRRLPMRATSTQNHRDVGNPHIYARTSKPIPFAFPRFADGSGGYYEPTMHFTGDEIKAAEGMSVLDGRSQDGMHSQVWKDIKDWDNTIFASVENDMPLPEDISYSRYLSYREGHPYYPALTDPSVSNTHDSETQDEYNQLAYKLEIQTPSAANLGSIIVSHSCATLSSMCFDWVFTAPKYKDLPTPDESGYVIWLRLYFEFFQLRFPRLKALQFRSDHVKETALPEGLYLLDKARVPLPPNNQKDFQGLDTVCIEFMEAHTKLQCLSWPMDAFFSVNTPLSNLAGRVDAIIDSLAYTLVDLRVDARYRVGGEPLTNNIAFADVPRRDRRRRFIEDFAARMKKVKSIKIEGGVPRDERRETIRALHACPVEKIVMIGVSCPLGNFWGHNAKYFTDASYIFVGPPSIEGEDEEAIFKLGSQDLSPVPHDFKFEANYGWSHEPPLIRTIATFHGETVTELKFCGYQGSPLFDRETPITTPLLRGLRHFEKLESLILSMQISTVYEHRTNDMEVIRFWQDSFDQNSTALAIYQEPERLYPISDLEFVERDPRQGWYDRIRSFRPAQMAEQVANRIGAYVSPVALKRPRGVHLRTSFCLGDENAIFDLDLRMRRRQRWGWAWQVEWVDEVMKFEGPRTEMEEGRRREKIEGRRWF